MGDFVQSSQTKSAIRELAILIASVSAFNLIVQDFGKHAYTFIDRKSKRAIRLVQRAEPVIQRIDPVASALREKVMEGTATPARTGRVQRAAGCGNQQDSRNAD